MRRSASGEETRRQSREGEKRRVVKGKRERTVLMAVFTTEKEERICVSAEGILNEMHQ